MINPDLHLWADMSAAEIAVMLLVGVWVFVPALLPNSAAVVFGGGTPVDFGRSWRGKRILGDGKTWRGFFGGAFSGIVLGLIMIGAAWLAGSPDLWGYGTVADGIGIVACLAVGSLVGDMLGSFLKRRLGIERGMKAPILDQYDFVIGAFLVVTVFYPQWVWSTYVEGWHIAALVLLLALVWFLHRGVNIIGYRLGLKNEPW